MALEKTASELAQALARAEMENAQMRHWLDEITQMDIAYDLPEATRRYYKNAPGSGYDKHDNHRLKQLDHTLADVWQFLHGGD